MIYNDVQGNLFDLPKNEYVFAHCIAADLKWGAGIAPILISKEFDAESLCRYAKDGGDVVDQLFVGDILPIKCNKGIFVNLITKRLTFAKPTYNSLAESLNTLKNYMIDNNLTKLAMPRIGCGIDGLEWLKVEAIIKQIFENTEIEIEIRHF